jgi:hypothetical protein
MKVDSCNSDARCLNSRIDNLACFVDAFWKGTLLKKEADKKRKSRGKEDTKTAKVSEKKAKRSGKVSEKNTFAILLHFPPSPTRSLFDSVWLNCPRRWPPHGWASPISSSRGGSGRRQTTRSPCLCRRPRGCRGSTSGPIRGHSRRSCFP